MILGSLICKWKGHKRGKLIETRLILAGAHGKERDYRCPRCGATWTRKVKAKAT